MVSRRKALKYCVGFGGAALASFPSGASELDSLHATLTLEPSKAAKLIPADFCGLSYEAEQLANPALFSPANNPLIALTRRLGRTGVLRIGGYTNELTRWTPEANSRQTGAHDDLNSAHIQIKPQCIMNLAGFLDATGWRLIYGLNFGTGTPTAAADEAEFVAKTLGSRLLAFQIGNEPDLFGGVHRPRERWDFAVYYEQWLTFAKEVRRRLPKMPLGAPDSAECCGTHWVLPFAERAKDYVQILSGHYYAESNPSTSDINIEKLFEPEPRLEEDIGQWRQASGISNVPFRMTEGNSCSSGGKPGVSDAFCSALWGADFMLKLASKGFSGVNFHGGGNGSYRTVPGEQQTPIDRASFHYSPIAGIPATGFLARPLYYGMLLASQLTGGTLLDAKFDTGGLHLTAYATSHGGGSRIAIFNKQSSKSAIIRINTATRLNTARVCRLTAPGLDSTRGTTLAGTEVAQDGAWEPLHSETVEGQHGTFFLSLPAASAALVFV